MNNSNEILVLGATSDMAKAISREFARRGFNVILAARNAERLYSLSKDLMIRFNVETKLIEFDALHYHDHQNVLNLLSHKCTVVLCAFGYLGDQDIARKNWNESRKIIDVNYTGAVSILNVIADHWQEREEGTIIGISSVAGDRGRSSNYIYGSAKAAFSVYLDGLRNKLFHHGLHVMTVKPGFVLSKMTSHLELPDKLTVSPDQVAKAIFKGYRKSANTLYIGGIWRLIMIVIRNIPEQIFKRLKM